MEVPNDLVCKMENLRGLVLYRNLKHRGSSRRRLGLSGRQKNLHSLNCGAGTWMAKELPTLSLTLQNLDIHEIQTMEEVEAIYQCPSVLEGRLCTLSCHVANVSLNFDLERLRECTTLWSLHLDGGINCMGSSIQFPLNLVTLTLSRSRIRADVDLMEVLGQLRKLKYLALRCAYLGTQLSCAGTAFPQLHELHLIWLPSWQEWRMEDSAMNGLNKLTIYGCWKLKKLPERIKSITTLKELEITHMPTEVCKRLGYSPVGHSVGGGEDSYIIHHIPSVKVSTFDDT